MVRVTDVSVPPLTEALIGAIGLTPAVPDAGSRVTRAGAGAAELLDDVAPPPLAGRDEVAVGLVEVDRCPVDLVAVHAASANTATAAATAHRAPPATASSEATTTHADGVGHLIVTIRSAIPA